MFPDANPDNPNVKQRTGEPTEGITTSQKTVDNSSPEKLTNTPKDGLTAEKIEDSTPKVAVSAKRKAGDDSKPSPKKFVRRLVRSAQDKPLSDKDSTKSNSQEAGSVSNKDESSLVSGEAKNG